MKTVVLMEEYMRKKKHKKKNKNMKKREIQKMQVENQQEVLGADVDKNQVENQQEILVDAAEKEQRRTTRLGAIIAIVTVYVTPEEVESVNMAVVNGNVQLYKKVG